MASGIAGSAQPTKALAAEVSIGGGSSVGLAGARVRTVIWRSGREPNYAEIVVDTRFENFAGIAPNDPVRISLTGRAGYAGSFSIPLFVGRVTGRGAEYSPSSETAVVVALGPRWDLAKDFVNGQETDTFDPTGSSLPESRVVRCVTAAPCVFNPGWGNRTPEAVTEDGAYAFTADPRVLPNPKRFWDAQSMLEYVYRQRLRANRREFGPFDSVPNIVGDPLKRVPLFGELVDTVLMQVAVNGMDLATAIDTVLSGAGYRWWIKPLGVGEGGPYGELKIATKNMTAGLTEGKRAMGKVLSLPRVPSGALPTHAVANPKISSSANHNRGVINEDYSRTVSQVVAFGSPTKIELEVTMPQGWRPVDEAKLVTLLAGGPGPAESPYGQIHRMRIYTTEATAGALWQPFAMTADDGETEGTRYFADVGRLFLLNDTGYEIVDESGAPSGSAFKFPFTPDDSPIVPRPRPFLNELLRRVAMGTEAETASVARRNVSAQLHVMRPAGLVKPASVPPAEWDADAFVPAPEGSWAFEPDRAGVRITDEHLLRPPFFNPVRPAAPGGGGPTPPWKPFARFVKLAIVVESDWLVSAGVGQPSGTGARAMVLADGEFVPSGAVGDTVGAQLAALAGRKIKANSEPIRSASFSIPWITQAYEPGDWITKIDGRNVAIVGQVESVRFDLDAQDTHIQLEDVSLFLAEGD